MLLAIALSWSIGCADINKYRAQGYSDAQMETWAREHYVPERLIRWLKVHCR